jgi:hypothetical protein
MKVNELRSLIKKHKREELEYIIVELYKMLTKVQKEDNDADCLITKPVKNQTSRKNGKKQERTYMEIEKETLAFIENALGGYYTMPNRSVSKKDRPKWRFVAKRLFNEISTAAQKDENKKSAAQLITNLYLMLCHSCGYILFTAYDTFDSVGIPQTEFFDRVLKLNHAYMDKGAFVEQGINLVINNYLNRYTLYSELMEIYIRYLPIPDLKYTAIKTARGLYDKIQQAPVKKESWGMNSEYAKDRKLNNLAEIIFRCYAHLYEFDNAIDAYLELSKEKDPEISLYVLVSLLFAFEEKELIVSEINKAMKQGIEPRSNLMKLKTYVEKNDKLPEYMN